ncbi:MULTISPECIES: hypothetical protein [unclassified Streptomyces]|uniref:hypothetical protein n=1 Tax=unclassified Streptomyces TaxID=2593676 RepID=UPI000962DB5D|nr:hypothetical protein [Streptomyces sp. TSRI0281]OKI37819.1 hypothetical protein A6A29_40395 [Streptomyces sp. TSRI0281]
MNMPKCVTTKFQRIPGRGASRPIRSSQVAVLVLGVLAGLLGCSASSDTSRPELDVPSVFYVSRDPEDQPRFGIKEQFGEQGAGHYTVAVDATDLKGVAVLKTGQDACPVRLPAFHCGGELLDRRHSGQSFRVSPADGAEAGDSAVLHYRLTSPGLPSVTASTRVVVGKPALAVETRADRDGVTPGGRVAVSLTLRNTGDVPARGVSLFIGTRDGLRMAGKHRNCRYRGTTSAWCRLPADDVVIPPGATYHLAAPEAFTLAADATYPTVTFEAAGLGEDYVPPEDMASQYESGQGSALRYVPGAAQDGKDAGAPHATGGGAAHLQLAVRSTSDLVALADTARGPVGSRADVRVGVRNDGPGALPAKVKVKVEFAVPAGTTVVSSPYDPLWDEEVIDQVCRALAANGTPLGEASVRQPSARRYVCTAEAGKSGATTTFPFTLRIDKEMAHRGGRVTVADGDSHQPSNDPKSANDSADVTVSVWPGPAWATPGLYATAGIALGVFVLVAALATWRRRRSR